jgi:DNA-binding transcriptional LysR family regulator
MDFRLRQLRTIVAVADAHSFTLAARQLRLSQQSVSALVRDLELRLGTKLFLRTTRSVEPTTACEELVAQLRPALADLDTALERAAGQSRERPLLIAITPALAYGELTILLESLESQNRIEPQFRDAWADDISPGLIDGRFDAAICIETPVVAGLNVQPWRRYRVDLLVCAAHRFADREAVAVADLAGSVLIIPGQASNPRLGDLIAEGVRSAGGLVDIRDAPRVAGPAPIAVERGEAATIWLTGMADRYIPAGLVRIPLHEPELWVESSLISLRRNDVLFERRIGVLRDALARTSTVQPPRFTTADSQSTP